VLPAVATLLDGLGRFGYVADRSIATALHLATELRRPLLIEGEAGVGKTEIAKVLADYQGTRLIRLQCYEGLDSATTLYEWNYAKQMIRVQIERGLDHAVAEVEKSIFSQEFLLKRPLLEALTEPDRPPVLLIDEIDRADMEFEAFLLEFLSEFQISIPELGVVRAAHPPYVILTSNRTRELSEALLRRCFYLWIDYPSFDKEVEVIRRKVDGIDGLLASQIAAFVQALRARDLAKVPGLSETVDWARCLVALHCDHLTVDEVEATLGAVLKDRHDISETEALVRELVENIDRIGARGLRAWAEAEARAMAGQGPG
jgi:MoxR-like ATPase